ncbi:hypothetical protein B7C42_05672 [Nocardia cerradoensis]|uniref:HD domain-containing protein n=1 Tax=Nocardia cerradoensis TaxID=85688 RepID=A0A231GZN8_9NOCA|nr:HD domain-containing protein [Nocardia cerradoensis]OXR42073.1 hypothetical protein B7C42_05672 [Nocardia cerradoensis]
MKTSTEMLRELDPQALGPSAFCAALFSYLEHEGATMYDETVTQLEHGLQSAALAEQEGYGPDLQIAALLHDIGHLMLSEHDARDDFLATDLQHEIVGAHLVTQWFGAEVGGPIALHVPAKRYLVATDPGYADGLSAASIRSLEVQGGPMSTEEVQTFETLPYHAEAVLVRRWDDRAKVAGLEVAPLQHWRPAIELLISAAADQ